MKNTLALIFTLLLTNTAFAKGDSLGVFYQPQKVIILINELGYEGRLHNIMNAFGVNESFEASSTDETIKFTCMRIEEAASCSFKFLPGKDVLIASRSLKATAQLSDLKLGSENFEISFESAMSDKFTLKSEEGTLNFVANKKLLK